jgi:hypothetical protein
MGDIGIISKDILSNSKEEKEIKILVEDLNNKIKELSITNVENNILNNLDEHYNQIIYKDNDREKVKDFILGILGEAQNADISKTRMRQSLKDENQEEVEKFLCPELYSKKDYRSDRDIEREEREREREREERELKNKKDDIDNKRKWLLAWVAIVGLFFTAVSFGYTIWSNGHNEQIAFVRELAQFKEGTSSLTESLNKIEEAIPKIGEKIELFSPRLSSIETEVKGVKEYIIDLKRSDESICNRFDLLDKRVTIIEQKGAK